MAIEIKMTGICENCACAALELDSSVYYGGDKPAAMWSIRWSIRCTKESACNRIIRMAEYGILKEKRNQNE